MSIKITGNNAPLYTEVILVLKQLYRDVHISSSVKKRRLIEIQKITAAMLTNL